MKWRTVPGKRLIIMVAISGAVACNNAGDKKDHPDTANALNDTFPATHSADTIAVDSNPPDATKVDSGNRDTH